MFQKILLSTLGVLFSVSALAQQPACQAICAYMDSEFVKREGVLPPKLDRYYRLKAQLYRVVGTSYEGLARHCGGGYLLSSYEKVFIKAQMTPRVYIEEDGEFLHHVVNYDPANCMQTVVDQPASSAPTTGGSGVVRMQMTTR